MSGESEARREEGATKGGGGRTVRERRTKKGRKERKKEEGKWKRERERLLVWLLFSSLCLDLCLCGHSCFRSARLEKRVRFGFALVQRTTSMRNKVSRDRQEVYLLSMLSWFLMFYFLPLKSAGSAGAPVYGDVPL